MKKSFLHPLNWLLLITIVFAGWNSANANPLVLPNTTAKPALPILTPQPPALNAKAYILIDVHSGKILAEKNADERRKPASLTKMMTLYVVSNALKNGQISYDDKVRISRKAWQTGGSRMFVKAGQLVTVRDLLKGIIVDSGNDACVAMAEHVAGNENSFADLMNQIAKNLGMTHSHFTDSTGLPHPNHFSTARDLSILARHLILDFPEDYKWYKQKWFTFNGIKQPNRNRLLWRDPSVDGIKTGHTQNAGYCLVSSAVRNNMRLLAVVMGAPTDEARAEDSQRLLTYGYRFFETHKVYSADQTLDTPRVWSGAIKKLPVGLTRDLYVTVPKGEYKRLKVTIDLPNTLKAPIKKGQKLGTVKLTYKNQVVAERPVVALQANPKGGIWTRVRDGVGLSVHNWFSGDKSKDQAAKAATDGSKTKTAAANEDQKKIK